MITRGWRWLILCGLLCTLFALGRKSCAVRTHLPENVNILSTALEPVAKKCYLQASGSSTEADLESIIANVKFTVVHQVWFPDDSAQLKAHGAERSAGFITRKQWEDMKHSGIFDHPRAEFHYVISTLVDEVFDSKKKLLYDIAGRRENIYVHRAYGKSFEFPGINVLWQLACKDPERLYLYFHNKGVTRTPGMERTDIETYLFWEHVYNYKWVIANFVKRPGVSHASFMPSKEGHHWHNFFWAKGEYVRTRVPPEKHPPRELGRHYYEAWMGMEARTPMCLNSSKAGGLEVEADKSVYSQNEKDIQVYRKHDPGSGWNSLALWGCGEGGFFEVAEAIAFVPLIVNEAKNQLISASK